MAEKNGDTTIHISHNKKSENTVATSSSLLRPKEHIHFHPHIEFVTEVNVITMTIDTWAEENEVDHTDIMWPDMQGMEFQVLRSSPHMLSTASMIYSEVNLRLMYVFVIFYNQYKEWMISQGFRVAKEELLWEDIGNILFVRDQC